MAWKQEYKTKDGQKRYQIVWRDESGKKHSRSFVRSKDADSFRLDVIRRDQLGELYEEAPLTFGEFAGLKLEGGRVELTGAGWFRRYQASVRPSSYQRRVTARQHLEPLLATRIDQLRPADVQDQVMMLAVDHPRTAKVVHETIQLILRNAKLNRQRVDERILELHPPIYETPTKQHLRRKQLEDLAEESEEPRLIMFAALTGLRISELFALQDGDFDFDRGVVHVDYTLSRQGTREAVKTKRGRRIVPLPKEAARLVKEQMLARAKGAQFVFCAPSGKAWRNLSNFYRRVWIPAREAVGLTELKFHDLRHTYASFMIAAGVHPKVLQELMGHASIAVTMDTYGHLFDGQTRLAVDALERWMEEEEDGRAAEAREAAGEGG
jgi:integrase